MISLNYLFEIGGFRAPITNFKNFRRKPKSVLPTSINRGAVSRIKLMKGKFNNLRQNPRVI